MAQKPKLELTWIGKGNRPKLEPRILLEDPEKSYHAVRRARDSGGSRRTQDSGADPQEPSLSPPKPRGRKAGHREVLQPTSEWTRERECRLAKP